MDQVKIGKFIAKLRKENNYTQENLANEIGVSYKAISRWENGHGLPDVSLMQPLCKILKISVSELLNGEKTKDETKKDSAVVDYLKYQKKKNIIRNIIISIISLFVIAFLILLIYFINNYNSIKVQHLDGESEHFTFNEGLFIQSKDKYFYVYGSIGIKDNKINKEDITKITLKSNDKLIYGDSIIDRTGYIYEPYGYNEYFDDNKVDNIDNWYVIINYYDNKEIKEEVIELDANLEMINNKLINNKVEAIDDGNTSNYEKFLELHKEESEKLNKLLEEKNYNNDRFFYSKKVGNYTIDVFNHGDGVPKIELTDGVYQVDYFLNGQILTIIKYDKNKQKQIASVSYERKSNSFKCSSNVSDDMIRKNDEYIEFFDKEFDELIPPSEKWGTIFCEDSKQVDE